MKKFDNINKHMNANKTKPINKKSTIDFLPASKFIQDTDKKYDYEVIVKFFASNNIALKDFKSASAYDEKCTVCTKSDWLVWRNDFMYYDTLNKCLINVGDDEELEDSPELEEIDFAVYVCRECGAWLTVISSILTSS